MCREFVLAEYRNSTYTQAIMVLLQVPTVSELESVMGSDNKIILDVYDAMNRIVVYARIEI